MRVATVASGAMRSSLVHSRSARYCFIPARALILSLRSLGGLVFTVRHVLAIAILLLAAPAAMAANIEVKQVDSAAALVMVEGDLELSDIEVFRSRVAPLSKATVAFRSDGGSLLAGIRIGMLIRVKNFTTIVPDAAQCASACAVAWLGGAHRFLGVGSKVGFHAAYVQKAGGATESGPGNAVLGAYLDQIGLPEDAIVYITQAAPNSMKWLNMEEAAQHGIDVALLPPADAAAAVVGPERGRKPGTRAGEPRRACDRLGGGAGGPLVGAECGGAARAR